MTTVDSWPKTLPMPSVGSWNSTTETHRMFTLTIFLLGFTWTSYEILSLAQKIIRQITLFRFYCTQSALWLAALPRLVRISAKKYANLAELVELSVLSSCFSVLFWKGSEVILKCSESRKKVCSFFARRHFVATISSLTIVMKNPLHLSCQESNR